MVPSFSPINLKIKFYIMAQEKRTVKIIMSIDIETNKPLDEVKTGLIRGVYRGLDTEPYYIAIPHDIKINYCQERD